MAKVTEGALYTGLAKSWHLHFCSSRDCRLVYECSGPVIQMGTCNARSNGRCQKCRDQIRPIWVSSRDPRPCCLNNVVQVLDRADLLTHRLAGPGPWYRCRSCARTTGWPQGHPTPTHQEGNRR